MNFTNTTLYHDQLIVKLEYEMVVKNHSAVLYQPLPPPNGASSSSPRPTRLRLYSWNMNKKDTW